VSLGGLSILRAQDDVGPRMKDDGPAGRAARTKALGQAETLELPGGASLRIALFSQEDEEADRHGFPKRRYA